MMATAAARKISSLPNAPKPSATIRPPNSGPAVCVFDRGALLVSVAPIDQQASQNPARSTKDRNGLPRADRDPDLFASGFRLGSGTSYAAPVLAGRIAASLVKRVPPVGATEAQKVQARVGDGWTAVSSVVSRRDGTTLNRP